MSTLHVACPSCRAPAGLGCTTQAGEPTTFHAPREALGVPCRVCKAKAGIACSGLPAGRLHHPERLYAARGQAGPGARTELRRLVEDLWHFAEAHPQLVAELHLSVRVRTADQVPPVFGEGGDWIYRHRGKLQLGVGVAEAETPAPPPRRPDRAPPRALRPCGDARPPLSHLLAAREPHLLAAGSAPRALPAPTGSVRALLPAAGQAPLLRLVGPESEAARKARR